MSINFNLQNDNHLILKGDLVFHNIEKMEKQFHDVLSSQTAITVDLAGIAAVDTSGLALLITWKHNAKKKNIQLDFNNVPQKLQSIAELSGVQEFFNI
ncbi:MAG: lipid asymmetry maintenance protein MlaB [Gammaproteobacteria bacterium]